jgi:dual specificity tyrosine-phosphorylation-regulated kinase 2/3/4
MSTIAPAIGQRVARLKPSSSNSSLSTLNALTGTTSTSSGLTAQTASSLQKQPDTFLHEQNQLHTIAGSSSAGSINSHTSREPKEVAPSILLNLLSSNTKEAPTRIPRISSRVFVLGSPTLKNSTSAPE